MPNSLVRLLIACALLLTGAAASAEGPGRLIRYDAFPSAHVEPRGVTIWLPDGYDGASDRYPVLYMHDGQNLFDPAIVGDKGEWGVDEALAALVAAGEARPAIVVGVWNTPRRLLEYMPAEVFAALPPPYEDELAELYKGKPVSDRYLRFLVEELKPWVDANFRTLTGRDDTFVAGSSMGGLISLYAISEYPEIYGGAAMISTHWPLFLSWPVEPRPAAEREAVIATFENWLRTALPAPENHRLWFDYGSATIDALYEPYQLRMDQVVAARGYERGRNWRTESFPGAPHDESAWRERVHLPLAFLLGPEAGRE